MEDFERRALARKIINLVVEEQGERFRDTWKQKTNPRVLWLNWRLDTGLHCVFVLKQITYHESTTLGQVDHSLERKWELYFKWQFRKHFCLSCILCFSLRWKFPVLSSTAFHYDKSQFIGKLISIILVYLSTYWKKKKQLIEVLTSTIKITSSWKLNIKQSLPLTDFCNLSNYVYTKKIFIHALDVTVKWM